MILLTCFFYLRQSRRKVTLFHKGLEGVKGFAGLKKLSYISGFPKTIKTREKLSEYLTVVIYITSAQHAAVNFGQVKVYLDAFLYLTYELKESFTLDRSALFRDLEGKVRWHEGYRKESIPGSHKNGSIKIKASNSRLISIEVKMQPGK